MSLTIEMILGIDTSPHHADDHGISSKPDCGEVPTGHATQLENAVVLKRMLTTIERMALAVLSVVVSVLVPGFSSMMAFLGAFSAFLLTVIGPISAKISLSGRASSMDIVLLVVGLVMAVWGTASAFWSAV